MTARVHPLDFSDFERVLLAMALRDPRILDLLDADLLDELALDEVSWVRRRAAANPQARDEAKVAAALLG